MTADRKRVLVAEDNPGLARVLVFTLERSGYDVTLCRDGNAAWLALQHDTFDIMITDYQMPGITGEELCRKLRGLEQHTEMPIVMVTGRELELDVKRLSAELNLAAVYPKPYSPRNLMGLIQGLFAETAAASG